jgi:ribosome assembly protein YihI (activator of Der GTPase)
VQGCSELKEEKRKTKSRGGEAGSRKTMGADTQSRNIFVVQNLSKKEL